jgi:putative SOS response-associated peptidase YedK
MCNLYSITTNQAAIIGLFRVVNRYVGNLARMRGVFPDYKAPIIRTGAEGRELATARWGMPSSSKALMDATKKRAEKLQAKQDRRLQGIAPDGAGRRHHNIRNVKSKHDALARRRKSMRCAFQLVQRVQQDRRRRHLVRI